MAANLAGIGRRALLEKIVAAAQAARVATIVVPAADPVVVKAVAKVAPGMKAGRVAAGGHSTDSPKSSWRS
jgi:uncharacterized heparinase superfamily protein